jgi:phospholipase C
MTVDRRTFLRLLSTTSVAATFSKSIEKALAVSADIKTGTIEDVQHVVFLMQENRSFDHYFGTLRGVRGYGDPHPVTLPSGNPVWSQPNGTGTLLPFHPTAQDLGLQFLKDLPHNWSDTHAAWNNGNYDQWVPNKGTTTMAHLDRADIPFHYALADAFTICDGYHCSLLGPTDPNRYHMWTGWVGNDGAGGGPVISNAEAGYSWSTYPEKLETAGISWKIYQDVGLGLNAKNFWGFTSDAYLGNFGDNSLLYFHQYQNAAPGNALFEKALQGTNINAAPDMPLDGLFESLRADVAGNQLPQVSWIVAPEAFSEHGNWPANYGAWYVSQVLDALTSNPDVWSKTVLFVVYDENDGLFDHVVPPTPPATPAQGASTVAITNEIFPGSKGNVAGPYGLGVRVPMIAVSPWTRGGWVCSQTFDHTSLIRFLEQRFGKNNPALTETNITPWRRVVCGDLTSVFNFKTPNDQQVKLPDTSAYQPPDRNRHADYVPVPPTTQALPVQEPGVRLARALPYQLYADGTSDDKGGGFQINFRNTGKAGAVFQVRSTVQTGGPWTYTVEAGKSLANSWALTSTQGSYDLSVFGPNGFFRQFRGTASGATRADLEVEVVYDVLLSSLILRVTNKAVPIAVVRLTNAYDGRSVTHVLLRGLPAEIIWPAIATFGWYDLSITSEEDPNFLQRFAGHMENGLPSVSDPAFGGPAPRR